MDYKIKITQIMSLLIFTIAILSNLGCSKQIPENHKLNKTTLIQKLHTKAPGSPVTYFEANSKITCADINSWDVSTVSDMSYLFENAFYFNCDISEWDVSNVTDMTSMFLLAGAFNQDISHWDLDRLIIYNNIFYGTTLLSDEHKPLLK